MAHRDLVEVPPPVLRVHHDLGQSRRARRRVHEEQIVRSHRPLGARRRVIGGASLTAPSTMIGASSARSKVGTTTWCRSAVPSAASAAYTVVAGSSRNSAARDEHGCARPVEQVPDLTHAGARADADDRAAGLLAGEVDRVHARAVGEQHADARAGCRAGRDERAREAVRALVERAPGQVAVVRRVRDVDRVDWPRARSPVRRASCRPTSPPPGTRPRLRGRRSRGTRLRSRAGSRRPPQDPPRWPAHSVNREIAM